MSDPMDRDTLRATVRAALADGRLRPADLEELLHEARGATGERPSVTGVLEALGAVVVLIGAVLAYATQFRDLPDAARLLTPFVFPVALLGVWWVLCATGRPRWQREVAAVLGLAALPIAFVAAHEGIDDVAVDRWGLLASLVCAAVAGAMLRVSPAPLAAVLGLPAALVAAANFAANVAGMGAAGFPWLEIALAAVAALAAYALRDAGPTARGTAIGSMLVLLTAGAGVGVAQIDDPEGLTFWHLLLSLTVALAVVLAATLELPLVVLAAIVAGATWLMFVIPVAGSSTGWALAVVALGLALVGIGIVAARVGARRGREHA